MNSQYRQFLRLLEKWPLDISKENRDVGVFIRECVKKAFNSEQGFTGDANVCNKKYESLNRLISNQYANKYKRESTSSATGLTAKECNLVLSTEFLEFLQKENRGIFSKIFKSKE